MSAIEAVGGVSKGRDDINPLAAMAQSIMEMAQNLPASKAAPVLEAVEQINTCLNNMLHITSLMPHENSTSTKMNMQAILNDLRQMGQGVSMIAGGNSAGASLVREAVSGINTAMAQIDMSMVENAILNSDKAVKASQKADPSEIALDIARKGTSIRI